VIEWLSAYGSVVVLPAFFAIFLLFGVWAYRPANKRKLQEYGRIPLQESRDGE